MALMEGLDSANQDTRGENSHKFAARTFGRNPIRTAMFDSVCWKTPPVMDIGIWFFSTLARAALRIPVINIEISCAMYAPPSWSNLLESPDEALKSGLRRGDQVNRCNEEL